MAKRDEIKLRLRHAATASQKAITERQLDEAADQLVKKAHVRKQDLEILGESVVGDRQIFATTDTDDMNNLLGRLGDK